MLYQPRNSIRLALLVCCILIVIFALLAVECDGKSYTRRNSKKRTNSRKKSNYNNKHKVSDSFNWYPSKTTKKRKKSLGKYGKGGIAAGAVLIPSVIYLNRRRHYSLTRKIPTTNSSYIYYNSSDLSTGFNVNNNTFWTPLLLPLDKKTAINCLIVPRNITASLCVDVFTRYITNETKFMTPKEFMINSKQSAPSQSVNDINLCCDGDSGSINLTATKLSLLGLALLAVFANM
ncbi:unnamed protein product [Clavelina lepadiformis]|uniref:Uncharacterized protein n=1 Tax=Clavelina lepadiformis TaxID=159417 RepID=A0ABP0F394_CLALP